MKKSWFEKWFSNKLYLQIYKHRNDEDARNLINLFQRTITLRSDAKVLDIACGAGRHSLEFARRGFNVTGFDLSEYLISEAKKSLSSSKEKNLRAKFLIRDMRHFTFHNSYDIAANIFTSFGYFENDEENFSVIKNVSDSLKKGGYFIFDFLNKTFLEKNIVPRSREKFEGIEVIQKRVIEGSFVKKEIVIKQNNHVRKYNEVLKLYSLNEFKKMFESYGLPVVKLFGDYFGNKFSNNKSQRLIIIAKKI